MYIDYFKFCEPPFSIAPDPHFMFMSPRHQEGLAHLLYGIQEGGGFVALTGEVGTGKTTLCRCLLQRLPDNIDLALILNPKLNALELLAAILDDLGVSYDGKQASLKFFVDRLNQALLDTHARHRRTVLIIDEAQNLSLEVLEQIRLLTNLETDKEKLLQIILIGQPEFIEMLQRRELRQFNQRITARFHLTPLTLTETGQYIRHRLAICNGDTEIFNDSAIKSIFAHSQGVPRVINIICHTALLGAYALGLRKVTPAIVNRAAIESLGPENKDSNHAKTFSAALIVIAMLAGGFHLYRAYPEIAVENLLVGQASTTKIKDLKGTNNLQAATTTPSHPQPPKQKSEKVSFSQWINDSDFTLSASLLNTLSIWGKSTPSVDHLDCMTIKMTGLSCYAGFGDWRTILVINRPTVMEFDLPDGSKRYALLTKVTNDHLVFRAENDIAFPWPDVLHGWAGYFLVLWQDPKPSLKLLYPGQSSPDVLWLREQFANLYPNLEIDTLSKNFDLKLKETVMTFQKSKHLPPDGRVGVQTLFYIANSANDDRWPQLQD